MLNRIDFVSQLLIKFAPKVGKNDGDDLAFEKKKEKDQFFNDLNRFCDECKPDGLTAVFNHVEREHDFATIPKMGKFWKFAKKNDLIIKKDVKHNPYCNVCKNCGAVYSKLGRGCPKCRCTDAIVYSGETLPEKIIEVHEDCFYCTIYPEIKNHEKWMTFKDCGDYGKKQDAKCKPCQCKECCKQMMMYNSDQRGTIEKYRTKELAQPWLVEIEPISQMAADMIEHMKKTKFKELNKQG